MKTSPWTRAAIAFVVASGTALRADDTKLVSSADGIVPEGGEMFDMTPDGRFVLFKSEAGDLVPGDDNGKADVFVADRALGTFELVNIATDGTVGQHAASEGSLSADGRYVAFTTIDVLDPADNSAADVYLRDRVDATTTLVSHSPSKIGHRRESRHPRVGRDGSHVVFSSWVENLVSDDTNDWEDVFSWERATGTITRVSTDSSGQERNVSSWSPRVSADGMLVAFDSGYDVGHFRGDHVTINVGIYVKDVVTGVLERVDVDSTGSWYGRNGYLAALSPDGRFVLISTPDSLDPADTNVWLDGYVRDRALATTERVTYGTGYRELSGRYPTEAVAMSDDARRIAFVTPDDASGDDSNSVLDAYVFDRDTGVALRVSLGPDDQTYLDGPVSIGGITADGRSVLFQTRSAELWPGDGNDVVDVFVRELSSDVAAWTTYGAGFPGRYGEPTLALDDVPRRGTTVDLGISDSSGLYTVGVVFAGFASASLPTSLGGTLLLVPSFTQPVGLSPWGITLPLSIPTGGDLPGLHVYLQALELDSWAVKGVSFTAGIDLTIGD